MRTNSFLSLNSNWTFSIDTINATKYAASVPGTIHTDLMHHNIIEDPYFENNEHVVQWIENYDWVYETNFILNADQLTNTNSELNFEGIDTYAEIYLNSIQLGETNNMFRKWTFKVAHLLKRKNKLQIHFQSPIKKNRPRAQVLGYNLPADNEEGEIKVSPHCRKAAYHFGWDWAPRLVTSGIWKDVHLKFLSKVAIRQTSITTRRVTPKSALMKAEMTIWSANDNIEASVHLADTSFIMQLQKGDNLISCPLSIQNPTLWWPNGSGPPHIYHTSMQVEVNHREMDRRNISFGIRTVQLINQIDSIGTSFYFRINGQPLFMQGANYIPQDMFLPRVSDAQYRKLLIAAKNAHMNMLRIWGGGIYEKEIFYHLCDSLGILVWQDFMFAGTMYPGDQQFITNVSQEIQQQVRRLKKHPCIALWCGNNELEVAWKNWGWQNKYGYTTDDSINIWKDYLHLFDTLIPGLVADETPDIPYTRSSPLSNWGTRENFNHGSMHYWGVWHGRESLSAFKSNVGRFMVEFGMQSYPSLSTINTFASPQHQNLDSPVMRNRQKSYIGNDEISKHIGEHFTNPIDFEDFISRSQDVQALALKQAISAHKSSNGHCMGSLLWQLNDCWPGPSWSIIDYYGQQKKAYSTVQSAFTP